MIRDLVLVGSEDFDSTTDAVLQWLDYWDVPFYRINAEDDVKIRHIDLTEKELNFELVINGKDIINSLRIKSFWYRRGGLSLRMESPAFNDEILIDKHDKRRLINSLTRENIVLEQFLKDIVEKNENIVSVGSAINSVNNKLHHLKLAKETGLDIPATYIITKREKLIEKMRLHDNGLITKPMGDAVTINFEKDNELHRFQLYTNRVTWEDIESFPDSFSPSLFQERISKKFELRIFFVGGKCFTAAIFSQSDGKTSEDFRRYNWAKPNRFVPFTLPYEIENNIKTFMEKADLNSGSLDLIYSTEKKYYFLEVNPVGQFGMISFPCNYRIEKFISSILK
jgi:ATP-GRASP peptide maturase of grasp-with-spasm system